MTDQRPRPLPDETSRFYWDAAAAGRLMLQRCRSCWLLQFPPDVCCVHCQSEECKHRLHGIGFLNEAVSQLRGQCGERQVPDARVAVVTSGSTFSAARWC